MIGDVQHGYRRALLLDTNDSVAVALDALEQGDHVAVADRLIRVVEPVPALHKVAICRHQVGDSVRKHGTRIGRAVRVIEVGEHVHVHNLAGLSDHGDGRDTAGPLTPEAGGEHG